MIKIEKKFQIEIPTYSEPELWNQVAHMLHVWSQGLVIRLGASEIFVLVVANKVVGDFAVLKETICSIIIYKQRRQSACCHHETRLTQMHEKVQLEKRYNSLYEVIK